MARARFVRPEFFTSESLADLPFGARLLFIGIWIQSDLRGVFEHSPRLLRAQVFPYDEAVTSDQVRAWLDLLASLSCIATFEDNGKTYGYVCNWLAYQSISKREKEIGTKRPAPPFERVDPGNSPGYDTGTNPGTTQDQPGYVPLTPTPTTTPTPAGGDARGRDPLPPVHSRSTFAEACQKNGLAADTQALVNEWIGIGIRSGTANAGLDPKDWMDCFRKVLAVAKRAREINGMCRFPNQAECAVSEIRQRKDTA